MMRKQKRWSVKKSDKIMPNQPESGLSCRDHDALQQTWHYTHREAIVLPFTKNLTTNQHGFGKLPRFSLRAFHMNKNFPVQVNARD